MGAPERTWGRRSALAFLGIVLGCASAVPPQTETAPPPPSLPPETLGEPAPPEKPPAPRPTPTPNPTLVVVDAGGEEAVQGDLAAAARAERERRRAAGPPVAVLHDKNIREFAKDQKLTFANPEKSFPPQGAPTGAEPATAKDPESYWRDRGRLLRERWRNLSDELVEERARVADLRTRFYSTDDPYIRDAEVKPAWDRSLDRIDTVEREIVRVREELDRFHEEGQRAGALPAWLLEGVDLEPGPEDGINRPAEPGEPVIYEEKPN